MILTKSSIRQPQAWSFRAGIGVLRPSDGVTINIDINPREPSGSDADEVCSDESVVRSNAAGQAVAGRGGTSHAIPATVEHSDPMKRQPLMEAVA